MGQSIERFLYERGFEHPDVRALIKNQLVLAFGASIILMVTMVMSPWSIAFFGGSVLATFNFWFMAKAVQKLLNVRKGAVTALLLLFYGRLILTGVVIVAMIKLLDLPVIGILVGLSTVVVTAITWSLANVMQKAKEA